MVTASIFGADYWLGEICCVAQNESREMAENVALQIQFRSKGFSVLQTNFVVQFVPVWVIILSYLYLCHRLLREFLFFLWL